MTLRGPINYTAISLHIQLPPPQHERRRDTNPWLRLSFGLASNTFKREEKHQSWGHLTADSQTSSIFTAMLFGFQSKKPQHFKMFNAVVRLKINSRDIGKPFSIRFLLSQGPEQSVLSFFSPPVFGRSKMATHFEEQLARFHTSHPSLAESQLSHKRSFLLTHCLRAWFLLLKYKMSFFLMAWFLHG